jgi:D-alanine-D-alanine ligase
MLKVAILAGGISSEHEISCLSAGSVLKAIDREKFEPILIGIDRQGEFHYLPLDFPLTIQNLAGQKILPEIPSDLPAIKLADIECDIFFPVLHGPGGEDGQIQKSLSELGKPFVGSREKASANAMDKVAAKRIFAQAGLPVTPGINLNQDSLLGVAARVADLGYPVFVKPSRSGSSRGTHKVKNETELLPAINDALIYDLDVLIEQGIDAREIEVGILEIDNQLIASAPGEIKIDSRFEFYDFESKYLDDATSVHVPAEIPQATAIEIQDKARSAFQAIGASGFARVDFFLDRKSNKIYLNEINTIPGFTATSVYPQLLANSGYSYTSVITALIESGYKSTATTGE